MAVLGGGGGAKPPVALPITPINQTALSAPYLAGVVSILDIQGSGVFGFGALRANLGEITSLKVTVTLDGVVVYHFGGEDGMLLPLHNYIMQAGMVDTNLSPTALASIPFNKSLKIVVDSTDNYTYVLDYWLSSGSLPEEHTRVNPGSTTLDIKA